MKLDMTCSLRRIRRAARRYELFVQLQRREVRQLLDEHAVVIVAPVICVGLRSCRWPTRKIPPWWSLHLLRHAHDLREPGVTNTRAVIPVAQFVAVLADDEGAEPRVPVVAQRPSLPRLGLAVTPGPALVKLKGVLRRDEQRSSLFPGVRSFASSVAR